MTFYEDEDDIWNCPKHPLKRRRSGICPFCLRDKLASLCPDCAYARPCACTTTSSSSSFYRFSAAAEDRSFGVGVNEPTFRRSRSLVIPFLRSKPERLRDKYDLAGNNTNKSKTPSFWSIFKNKRHGTEDDHQRGREKSRIAVEEEHARMMTKSRSVMMTSHPGTGETKLSPSTKAKSWYHFPSPMKVFRQTRGLVSPLYRG